MYVDEFWHAKWERINDHFEPQGYRLEVRSGWSYDDWIMSLGIPATPSPDTAEFSEAGSMTSRKR
jgi:hypothetical protein